MSDIINGIQFGLECTGYRVEYDDGTYGPEKPIDWPVNLTLDPQSQVLKFYANDRLAASVETDDGFSGSLEALYFPDDFLVDVLGQVRDSDGAILAGGGAISKYFALHYMFKGDKFNKKRWACHCKAAPPTGSHTTTEGSSINADHETIQITAARRTFVEDDGNGGTITTSYATATMSDTADTHEAYESYFDMVPHGEEGDGSDASLNSLTIGTLALSPSFSSGTTNYTASTTSSSVTVNAVANASGATVVIKNGSTTVTNGQSASLSDGENVITIKVTNGGTSRVYKVVVTKS